MNDPPPKGAAMSEHKEKQGVAAIFGAIPDMPIDDEQQNIALDAAKWRKAMEGDADVIDKLIFDFGIWCARLETVKAEPMRSKLLDLFRALDHARREAEALASSCKEALEIYRADWRKACDENAAQHESNMEDLARLTETQDQLILALAQLAAEKQAHAETKAELELQRKCELEVWGMVHKEKQARETAEAENDKKRRELGECHLMISRNASKFQLANWYSTTSLPPRLKTIMQDRDTLQRRVEAMQPALKNLAWAHGGKWYFRSSLVDGSPELTDPLILNGIMVAFNDATGNEAGGTDSKGSYMGVCLTCGEDTSNLRCAKCEGLAAMEDGQP
jgi:hypothetical protein